MQVTVSVDGCGAVVSAVEDGGGALADAREVDLYSMLADEHIEADMVLVGGGMGRAANPHTDGAFVEHIQFRNVLLAQADFVVGSASG